MKRLKKVADSEYKYNFSDLSEDLQEEIMEKEREYRWQDEIGWEIQVNDIFEEKVNELIPFSKEDYKLLIDDINYGWNIKVSLEGSLIINEILAFLNVPLLSDDEIEIIYSSSGYADEVVTFSPSGSGYDISTNFYVEDIEDLDVEDYNATQEELDKWSANIKNAYNQLENFEVWLEEVTKEIEDFYEDLVADYMDDDEIRNYLEDIYMFNEYGDKQ